MTLLSQGCRHAAGALLAGLLCAAALTPAGAAEAPAAIVVTAESFKCLHDMTPVRGFFVDNIAGNLEGTLAVANSPTGGVYPPGSVVQLVDERFALVVSVNSSRPLKPKIIVYQRGVPKDEALMLDLEQAPALGIRRSLKPAALPREALDYLSPRQRMCYFFERAVDTDLAEPQP